MNSLKAMYGCGLNFFIKLAYNSLFLYKFAKKTVTLNISSIKVSPKQYNIPYKANACLILKKLDTRFFRQYKYCLMNLCV